MIKNKYILNECDNIAKKKENPLRAFLVEFHYAYTYLSRYMKVRSFTVYMLLFKEAYFNQGKKKISVNLSKLGQNLLSDVGKPMSYDVIKRGVNDLVRIGLVEKEEVKTGQASVLRVKLPSELKEVQEVIIKEREEDHIEKDDSRDDYYTDPLKRKEIFERDNSKCFYCLKELDENSFYLDHIVPRSKGGHNYQSNLVTSCKSCNTKKNNSDPLEFLMNNYRKSLITQPEYLEQSKRLKTYIKIYQEL